ncbi:MAG: CUAEP/CCAEP-tail radical SAM protein [Candidatus Rokubacteria bacterium]|nr:CUAEP/CCAEP-tail radical SAM protein [Candidatus Rokubacteria bacterium]
MRESGAILLISCYELGHQPLAIAWAAAVLERDGYRPAVMDVAVERFDPVRAARARLVVISVPMHTALRLGVSVAAEVRAANPACHVCFAGLYATLNAEYLLAHGGDSVVGGEVEEALAGLARALGSAGADGSIAPVPGIMRRGAPARPVLARLGLPAPSRSALPPLRQYAQLDRGNHRDLAGYVEATRGCLHLCRHCPIPPVYGGRFFAVPLEVVLADVRQQVAAGARHITFGDPDFLNGPGHALAVARALHAEHPELTFDVTAKVAHLLRHRRHLPELARLGCLFIVTAVESLSDTVLAELDKGHTRKDVFEVLPAVREAGIALRPTWVAFTPWTELDDYQEMLDFIETHDLVDAVDPVQYALRLLVPPGSLLAAHPGMTPYLDDLVEADFSYPWRHPDPRMDRLQAEVGAVVARGAEEGADSAVTFDRVRALADGIAGATAHSPLAARLARDRVRPPHLSEPWFC